MDLNRRTAYDTLLEIHSGGAYSNIALNRNIERMKPDSEAFVRTLVYGVIENQIYLDYKLGKLVKSGLKKVKPKVLVLLRLGAYQIEFLDSVPAYAAISETVNIARKTAKGLEGFVNGVLRNYERTYRDIELPDRSKDPAGYLSVKYSYNRDIADLWIEMYGENRAETIMKAANEAPPLTIRVNTLKTDERTLIEGLTREGYEVTPALTGNEELDRHLAGRAYNVKGQGILSSPRFKNGEFSVQDISSMIAIGHLAPKAGERLIDLCSAPGGKSMCAAEYMQNTGEIISCDIYDHKLELINSAASKNGVNIIKTEISDATVRREDFVGSADRVIVDAPCSGLGVIRRKPEIKLHTTAKDSENLAKIQLAILENAAEYVKPGGVLFYSTCTIAKAENHGVIELFLQKNKNYFLLYEKQLFPDSDNADGFYFTGLQRI